MGEMEHAIGKLKDKIMHNQHHHSTSMNNLIDDLLKERRHAGKAEWQSNTAQRKAENEKKYADNKLKKLQGRESSLVGVNDEFVEVNNELKETQDKEITILLVDGHFGFYLFCLNLHEKGK